MNPRALCAWSAAALTVSLITTNPVVRALVLLAALDVTVVLRRPDRRLRPLLVSVAVAGLCAVVLDVALGHAGAHVLLSVPAAVPGLGGPLTAEAAAYGVAVALGIGAAILAVAPLTLALEAHELVDACPRVLERTGVAAAAALNLVPGLVRSAVAVRDAQRMRGAAGGVRGWAGVLGPVAVTAMEDSLQLAEAMEARAYASGRRTRWRSARCSGRDLAVVCASLAAAALMGVARVTGGAPDWYPFPTLTAPPPPVVPAVACALLVTPVLVWRRPSAA